MLIKLDTSLKINDWPVRPANNDSKYFIEEQATKNLEFVTENFSGEGHVLHKNYLEYLEKCWASHYGVVLTPDIIWYTLLCELCGIVAEKPTTYTDLFTLSPDKTNISVPSDDLEVLPLDKITEHLKKLVPEDFVHYFLPRFSTSNERSEFAHQAAFADTVSPYYSYFMFACGLSAVRVDGTLEDWQKVQDNWNYITTKMLEADNSNKDYYDKVSAILQKIPVDDREFYKDMFYAKRCGSGSETEVFGWFTELFRVQPDSLRKANNFATWAKTYLTNIQV